MPDRHNQRSNLVPTWRRGLPLVLAAVLVWGLVCGGCAPLAQSDCDQLLQDHQWQTVLDTCKDPYDRSSAYLALGGFDLITLYDQIQADGGSLTALGIIQAFGLTTSNISTKRQYLEQATLAVGQPEDSAEAFALLVSAAMGMTVSSIEFLDNGMGGTALDGVFSAPEAKAALGVTGPSGTNNIGGKFATLSSGTLAGSFYLSGVLNGTPYVFACGDIVLGAGAEPWCDNNPAGTLQVNSDNDTVTSQGYGSGAGFQGASAGTPSLQNATPVSLVVQLTTFTLQYALNPNQVPTAHAFTGSGNASHGFAIGLEGYLSYLETAQTILTQSGSDQGTQNTLSDAIDGFKGQLDNGAACIVTLDANLATALDSIYPIYAAAIGTVGNPMPSGTVPSSFFQSFNQVAGLDLTSLGLTLPVAISGASFIFGQPFGGSVTSLGTRFLYPTQAGLSSFDPVHATPRIDQTPVAFQQAFEAMALAPNASPARDGVVSYAELLCVGAGTVPTGVTATASNGQVTISWNAASGATSYSVYRGTSSGVNQSAATKFTTTSTSHTDATVTRGTTYYYVVTSTNSDGEGGISREASVTP
jgi:hypothetical protein